MYNVYIDAHFFLKLFFILFEMYFYDFYFIKSSSSPEVCILLLCKNALVALLVHRTTTFTV